MKSNQLNSKRLIFYYTFNTDIKEDEVSKDLHNIKQKGFNGIIWKNHNENTITDIDENSVIQVLRRIHADTQKLQLVFYLDITDFCFKLIPRNNPPQTDETHSAQPLLLSPEYKKKVLHVIKSLKTNNTSPHGLFLQIPEFTATPASIVHNTLFVQKFEDKFNYSLNNLAKNDVKTMDNCCQLLSEEYNTALNEIKTCIQNEFGDTASLTLYVDSHETFSLTLDCFGSHPVIPQHEMLECAHAEKITQRPEELTSLFKIAQSRYQHSKKSPSIISIWSDDDDTADSSHSLEIMDYCTDLSCTFNVPLIPPAYTRNNQNYVKIIKKGTAYPVNPGWENIPQTQQKITSMKSVTKNAVPLASIAVIYPCDTLISYTGDDKKFLLKSFNDFIFKLLRLGYSFDIVHPSQLAEATLASHQLKNNWNTYKAVIVPFPEVLPAILWEKIHSYLECSVQIVFAGKPPQKSSKGTNITSKFQDLIHGLISNQQKNAVQFTIGTMQGNLLSNGTWGKPFWECKGRNILMSVDGNPASLQHKSLTYWGILPSSLSLQALNNLLRLSNIEKLAESPSSAFMNIAKEDNDIAISLCPSNFKGIINGKVEFRNLSFEITNSKDALAIRFDCDSGSIISHAVFGEAEIRVEH